MENSVPILYKLIKDEKPVKAVICEVDFNLSWAKLVRAQQYLMNPDCLFIVGATDLLVWVHGNPILGYRLNIIFFSN